MRIIGLTGGIGSGKSAAAACFREAGIPVIDADGIGHVLLEQNPEIRNALICAFGDSILAKDGAISRERIAESVFQNASYRQQLNAILHPAIIAEVGRQCTEYHRQGNDAIIVEAALIGESEQRDPWLSGLILVLASESIRIERLVRFRNFSHEEAVRRIAAQKPPEQKRALADWVIENSGDMDALRKQVLGIVAVIKDREA